MTLRAFRAALGTLAIASVSIVAMNCVPMNGGTDPDPTPTPAAPTATPVPSEPNEPFRLTLLHNNDGESNFFTKTADVNGTSREFGGVDHFAGLVNRLRDEGNMAVGGVTGGAILVSAGDNVLAGPEFNASLELPDGEPFFDAIAMQLMGYDVICIGNHEFDFGPDVLKRFVEGFDPVIPFVSCNLEFSGEPGLLALQQMGAIKSSHVVEINGFRVGVVGATTPRLRSVSFPRNVNADENVAAAVQAQVDAMTAMGINKIVLISHLQSIEEDIDLIPMLRDVDIVVAGGGGEFLAETDSAGLPTADANLIPGDGLNFDGTGNIFGDYPLTEVEENGVPTEIRDANGVLVPVVTTPGDYTYVGRLVVQFDAGGNISEIVEPDSMLVRVASDPALPDFAAAFDPVTQQVVNPVDASVDALAQNVLASSDVDLDGRRTSVRTGETNLGSLIADAHLWNARQNAMDLGLPVPQVALQNGGGIRNDSLIDDGDLTELDTFEILPFSNFVVIVPEVPVRQLKELLEAGVRNPWDAVDGVTPEGYHCQIAGVRIDVDYSQNAQETDDDGNIIGAGERIREMVLLNPDGSDGQVLVSGGNFMVDADTTFVAIATIDFLATGRDGYPFRDRSDAFTSVGVSYQLSLENYLLAPISEGGLGGMVTASQYPEGGSGRINNVTPMMP